ncbi:class I adenylate-forming enzyme family protein [Dermacoccaceae bacterium W4C1]
MSVITSAAAHLEAAIGQDATATSRACSESAIPQGQNGTEGFGPAPTATTDYVPVLLRRLGSDPRPVLRHPGGDIRGIDLAGRIRATAARLIDHQVGPGDLVAVLAAPNAHEMLVARYAAHLVGAGVVHVRSMNPRTDADELPAQVQAEVLRSTAATILITDLHSSERARDLVRYADIPVVTVDDSSLPRWERPHGPRSADCAVIDFTSGTTNAPRLVRHSFAGRGRLLNHLCQDVPARSTRLLAVTPISHTLAPMVDAALLRGGTVDLHGGFDAAEVLTAFAEGVTDVYLAVPHLCELLDHPGLEGVLPSRVRRIIYSGTPAPTRRVAQAATVFAASIVQVYGSTETGGITALTSQDHADPLLHGTVGRPFPWVEISVRDTESGEPVDGVGQIWVRSDTCFEGYLTDGREHPAPEWVPTGDMGILTTRGCLRLLSRVNGVVKKGGIKVYPDSVERVIAEHPLVREAVVQGRTDSERREQLVAVVAVEPDAAVSAAQIIDHVSARLSATHAPDQVIFWSGIPLLRSGKPDRRLVRELIGG